MTSTRAAQSELISVALLAVLMPIVVGLLIGDGTLKQDKAVLSVWPQSEAVNGGTGPHSGVMETAFALAKTLPHRSDFRGWMAVPGRGEYRMSLGALKTICGALGMSPGHKRITPTAEECSSEFYRGLLGGLFGGVEILGIDGFAQFEEIDLFQLREIEQDAAPKKK